MRWLLFVLVGIAVTGCGDPATPPPRGTLPDTFAIDVPGFPPMPLPPDNPLTRPGVALGRRLFHDPILSADNTLACAGCHVQAFAFSDRSRQFSIGIDGIAGTRNAPAIVNAAWNSDNFWDGRSPTLEDQALGPVPNPIEMHLPWKLAVEKLRAHAEYPELFRQAFGTSEITSDLVVKAIAQFERTLISNDSKYDRFQRGETTFSPSERRGLVLFLTEKGDCFHCHVVASGLFTDQDHRNNGLDSVFVDPGRAEVTGRASDLGKFRSPTLRNIAVTAPYMHDGRFQTLEQVLDHYNSGGVGSASVDPLIRVGRGLGLSQQDKQDLIAFLHTLTDSTFLANPDFAPPVP